MSLELQDSTRGLPLKPDRPYTTVVFAMSADGKISDVVRSAAGFGSSADKKHLEMQVAKADALLFGGGTLRADGTAERVFDPILLEQRQNQGMAPQPIQIICSGSGAINPQLKFFQQPVERWLITTSLGAKNWQERSEFERILLAETETGKIDWVQAFQQLASLNIKTLNVMGGGALVASLLAADLIDEFWLTVCPFIFGGATAPSPVDGEGFLSPTLPRLELLSVEKIEQEVFLHYRIQRGNKL
jgi:5-amino-6-(5-phosphoribosylamino)uracil reductase